MKIRRRWARMYLRILYIRIVRMKPYNLPTKTRTKQRANHGSQIRGLMIWPKEKGPAKAGSFAWSVALSN